MATDFQLILIVLVAVLLLTGAFFYFRLRKKLPLKETYLESIEEVKFAKVNGIEFCYQQIGRGEDLVLLHGLGANLYVWRFVIQELAKSYRVTTIDLPGFGQSAKDPSLDYDRDSQVERVKDLLDHLGIEKFYLMGSSMGGAISLGFGLKYPDCVLKIIGLSPATNAKILPFNPKPFLNTLSRTYKIVTRPFIRILVSRVVYNQSLVTDDSVDRYYAPYISNKNAVICTLKACEVIADPEQPQIYKKMKVPTRVLYGLNDLIVGKKHVNKLMKYLPNSELLTRPKVGHHTMEDAPKWVVENARDFFR